MDVVDYFYEISKIPRKTGDEKELSDFIYKIAKNKGLKVEQDNLYNLIIEIPGTNKSDKKLILQSHLDLVYDSLEDANSYECGINIINEDGFLKANKTTLGADNGIGVAMMIKLLESEDILHPNLILIFTVQEEIGLIGANSLDFDNIIADYMINLDSEEEGKFTIGCAGGVRSEVSIPIKMEKKSFNNIVKISCVNFKGGHSGLEINKNIPSAIKSVSNLLLILKSKMDYDLISIECKGNANSISRDCSVKIGIKADYKIVKEEIDRLNKYLKLNYSEEVLKAEILNISNEIKLGLTESSKDKILFLISTMPQGAISMSPFIENLVQTSSNIGIVSQEENMTRVVSSTRSSVDYEKEILKGEIELLAERAGGNVVFFGEYPAWELVPDTKLQKVFLEEYKNLFRKTGKTIAIHAGLECALFTSKIKGIDAISIGANIFDVHTTNEKVEIASVERTWELLKNVLEKL